MAYAPLPGGGAPTPKKISNSMVILTACLLGVVIGLLGLNYRYTSKGASSRSADEMDVYIEGIARRLLQAESQVCHDLLKLIQPSNSTIDVPVRSDFPRQLRMDSSWRSF